MAKMSGQSAHQAPQFKMQIYVTTLTGTIIPLQVQDGDLIDLSSADIRNMKGIDLNTDWKIMFVRSVVREICRGRG